MFISIGDGQGSYMPDWKGRKKVLESNGLFRSSEVIVAIVATTHEQ